jgi:nitrate reductase gamma subunit/ferredoxin
MSTTASAPPAAEETPAAPTPPFWKRLRPSQVVIAIGVAFAIVTVISGLNGWLNPQEESSDIGRHVFGGIPDALKIAFYTVIPALLVWGAVQFANRVKNWERGLPDNRSLTAKNTPRRARDFRMGVYMQTLLRDPAAGVMHSLIYFGFLILLGVTTTLELNHQLPTDLKFLHGGVYQGFAFIGDLAGLVFTAGVVWAIVRRYVERPYRIRIKSKPEHAVILATFLAIGLSGFATEMFRIAEEGMPAFERWSFIGYPLAELVDTWSASSLESGHQISWVVHVITFVVFLVILPITMLRHIFTSPLNMYAKDKTRPKGAMRPMPNLMETELESFGAKVVEDFTWKQLLDTDACTMCGRCTSVCPAHATGKPLDPREIVLKTGEVMALTGNPPTSTPMGGDTTGEPLAAMTSPTLSTISRGSSGLPVAWAGQTEVQRPHMVQASVSSSCFQVKSSMVAAPNVSSDVSIRFGMGFIAPFGRSLSRKYMFTGEVIAWRNFVVGSSTKNATTATMWMPHDQRWKSTIVPTFQSSAIFARGQPTNDHFS